MDISPFRQCCLYFWLHTDLPSHFRITGMAQREGERASECSEAWSVWYFKQTGRGVKHRRHAEGHGVRALTAFQALRGRWSGCCVFNVPYVPLSGTSMYCTQKGRDLRIKVRVLTSHQGRARQPVDLMRNGLEWSDVGGRGLQVRGGGFLFHASLLGGWAARHGGRGEGRSSGTAPIFTPT